MMNKKAQGISIRTIIIAIIALIVLVVLIGIFTGKLGDWVGSTGDVGDVDQYAGGILEKGSSCSYIITTGGYESSTSGGTCRTISECNELNGEAQSTQGIAKEQRCELGLVCCS